MIELTKIDGHKITINADEIETVETMYDTIITFCSGHRIIVKEQSSKITQLVVEYKKNIYSRLLDK